MARWVLKEDDAGWTVRCGRTSYGVPSREEAERFVEHRKAPGDTVVVEETDGYRTPLRKRKHWRR
jgi:hypothetical protein